MFGNGAGGPDLPDPPGQPARFSTDAVELPPDRCIADRDGDRRPLRVCSSAFVRLAEQGDGGTRNHFDKFAHFFQGAAPAAVFREILVRFRVAPGPVWLAGLTSSLTLALSAAYELFEWAAALLLQERAERFVASQGDPWDAQGDMAMALSGAVLMLALFSRLQDRQIARLAG